VVALFGLLYPAISGYRPDPIFLTNGELENTNPLPDTSPAEIPGTPSIEDTQPTVASPPTAVPTATETLPTARITNTGGAGANIRNAPGLGGTILVVLPENTSVFLLVGQQEVDGFNWQQIEMEDTREGWVVATYLTDDN
jgi:hypothetical protein